jgi:hypothetical protein
MSAQPAEVATTRVVRKVYRKANVAWGTLGRCTGCGESGWFAGDRKRMTAAVIFANIYAEGRWLRSEQWHPACYLEAGEPYGPPQDVQADMSRVVLSKPKSSRPRVRCSRCPARLGTDEDLRAHTFFVHPEPEPPPPASISPPDEGGKEHDMATLYPCREDCGAPPFATAQGEEVHHRRVHGPRAVTRRGGGQRSAPKEAAVAESAIDPAPPLTPTAASNGHHVLELVTDTSEVDVALAAVRAAFEQLSAARIRVRTPHGKEVGSVAVTASIAVDVNGHRVGELKGASS